jgi:ParB family chromosome partitioning protein
MAKNALGKGLGALISSTARRFDPSGTSVPADPTAVPPPEIAATAPQDVAPMADIIPSPMQPRKTFRDENLEELMESIKAHGLIQPLIVRRVNGKMELIAGERRFRAMQKLQLETAPIRVLDASDRDVLEMALVENLQREDLNPMEEAEAYYRLAKEFGMKQEEIAQRVGKNRATVANSMRLMDLTDEVKSLLAHARISPGHAKAILGLRDHALQNLIADMVVRGNLTVRQTEKKVQSELDGRKDPEEKKETKKTADANIHKLQNRLREKFQTQVTIQHSEKRGKIELEYYGNDDLGRLLELLGIAPE